MKKGLKKVNFLILQLLFHFIGHARPVSPATLHMALLDINENKQKSKISVAATGTNACIIKVAPGFIALKNLVKLPENAVHLGI